MAFKTINHDLAELIRSLDSTFAGQVTLPEELLLSGDDEKGPMLNVTIKPTDGMYAHCRIRFQIELTGYPETAPIIRALDTVAHPNINFLNPEHQTVCVSVLDDWYQLPYRDLTCLVQAVLFLLHNPDCDDALVTFDGLTDLTEIVDGTKHGTPALDEHTIAFSDVYEGPCDGRDEEVEAPAEGEEEVIPGWLFADGGEEPIIGSRKSAVERTVETVCSVDDTT